MEATFLVTLAKTANTPWALELDDDVNEVKRGVRYIVGYQAACIIPQADIKITE